MARVRPFCAWRYASRETDITPLVAPPYDVISAEMREDLLGRHEHNVVRLELPDGALDPIAPDNRYYTGAKTWNAWRQSAVIEQDPQPAVYVLEQRFRHEGRQVRRRALIAEVGLEPFDAGVILRHERVLPKALGDRFELIKATHANFSQVFGLFGDATGDSDPIFETAAALDPIETAIDDDGVESLLWRLDDPTITQAVAELLEDKQIFIADGHHRYTTALAYRDLRRELADAGDEHPLDPDYDFVMMALVNMDDPDLEVLPYNRIADGPAAFEVAAFTAALAENFDVAELAPDTVPAAVLAEQSRPAFVMQTRGATNPSLVVLKRGVDLNRAITAEHSAAWKSLDVSVLQELVLWPLLGIHPDHAETLERLSFTKDASAALRASSEHDVAFVLRPTRLEQLREVSLGGETMPQKSTYFYPKLLSGLLFRGMTD